ncbi:MULTISPECIES: SDR family NAD(P)-dependent oxidoreductase [Tsukamurella]|uniref:SDR family oxidoreductase n=2 Tax=Tsukamurella TaxID=2060 RepID=A0A5C5S0Y2_9ACTN|nr:MULTISPECIES: SDR family oxidoreductase [Tsukamurella]NMD54138.1 SDR family oxidoreductase [Tsukamurella columbiensis]TWS28328.1 SDR family oxidoreductase [Tsukamurella conjunctivitidis]
MSLPTPTPHARIVVTGASSGIGEALAEAFARRGHSLILVARREDRLRALADRLSARYVVTVDVVPCDLADAAARAELIRQLDTIDVSGICLNAGFASYGSILELDPQREREQVDLNVVAVHDLVVGLLPALVARGSGVILVTGSTAGNQPSPNNATYAATKAFANTLSESLHGELVGTGVTCTLLAPGPVRTEFAEVSNLGAIEQHLPGFAWVTAETAAEAAVRGAAAGRRRVVPGATAKLQDLGGKYAPRSILNPILRKAYGDLR